MPLPEGFSEWKHLQSTLIRVHNPFVKQEFSDIEADDDISVPRGSLKLASLIKDDDSAPMVLNRLWLFYFMVRKGKDLQAPLYGLPDAGFHDPVQIYPQVSLFFQQDWSAVPDTKIPLRGKVSFRLVDETAASITPTKANQLAQKIRNEFAAGGGYLWNKGKVYYRYIQPSKGYAYKILANSKAEAQELIRKVMSLQNDTPDWDNLYTSTREYSFPTNQGKELIYGKQRARYVRRRSGTVRFTHALLQVPGLVNPIVLVDRTHTYQQALQTV